LNGGNFNSAINNALSIELLGLGIVTTKKACPCSCRRCASG